MWIPKRSSKGTLKEKCKEFYDSYECENKSWFLGFYQKVSHNPDTPREELIVKRATVPYKYKTKRYTWKHKDLWEWYSQQKSPEVKFPLFVSRVNDWWYPKEIAITNGAEWEKAKTEKAKAPRERKSYWITTPKYVEEKPIEIEDYFFIKVKYPEEIARVFIKEYENLIEELEWKSKDMHDKESRDKLEQQIIKIHTELMVFKCYNDM